MTELIVVEKLAEWQRLKALVLDSVSSPITRRVYNMALDEFINWYKQAPRPGFTKATVSAWRVSLEARGLGSSSIIIRMSAIRKLAVEATDNGLLAPELAAGIARVKSAKSVGIRVGNWLSLRQAQALLSAPGVSTVKGLRDRAILAVLLGCGLRRSEVAALTFPHVQQRDGRWCIVDLVGKHGRVRTVPMPTWVKVAIDAWTSAAGLADDRIFRPVNRGDKVHGEAMSEKVVWQMLRQYATGAGVPGIAPHDCRRSCAKLCRVDDLLALQGPEAVLALFACAKPAKQKFRTTDYGNAERLVSQQGTNLHFCHPWRKWLHWTGERWAVDASAEVVRLAKAVVRTIYREAADIEEDEVRKAVNSWARESERTARITAMIHLAESEDTIPVDPEQLDSDRWLLNCLNGTIDLRTGERRPHNRKDLITKLASVEYRPGAKCVRWLRFLSEVFGPHSDLTPFIQRAVGYSLTGDTREECLFLLHGTGRNGKGTFIKALSALLGDYAGTADFSAFVARKDQGPRDDIANMKGKHFISAQESREGAALAESLIKWLTGGDRVRARRLYENSYEFDPTHKIWLATNHKPVIRGTDPAIWSRIKLIPFDVSFEGKEDRELKSALIDELPGILNWAIEGCLAWLAGGLQFPESVVQATHAYRTESDQVIRFVEDSCVTGDAFRSQARHLYAGYKSWAEAAGEEPFKETAFGRRLAGCGYKKEHTERGNVYLGIAMKRGES